MGCRMIRGESVSTFSGTSGFEQFSARVEPHGAVRASFLRRWRGTIALRVRVNAPCTWGRSTAAFADPAGTIWEIA